MSEVWRVLFGVIDEEGQRALYDWRWNGRTQLLLFLFRVRNCIFSAARVWWVGPCLRHFGLKMIISLLLWWASCWIMSSTGTKSSSPVPRWAAGSNGWHPPLRLSVGAALNYISVHCPRCLKIHHGFKGTCTSFYVLDSVHVKRKFHKQVHTTFSRIPCRFHNL